MYEIITGSAAPYNLGARYNIAAHCMPWHHYTWLQLMRVLLNVHHTISEMKYKIPVFENDLPLFNSNTDKSLPNFQYSLLKNGCLPQLGLRVNKH